MLPAKRKPLSVMIALASDKNRGGRDYPDESYNDDGDRPDDEEPESSDEEVVACQDVLDAIKNRDPKALGVALHNWMRIAGYERTEEE